MKKIFIIVPSASLASPVRGACALANQLTIFCEVTFISLKGGKEALNLLNKKVNITDLGQYKSWLKKLQIIKNEFSKIQNKKNVVSISIGLSADLFNSFYSNHALTCSSVRGDLPKVYPETYGKFGKLIAYLHLKRLRKINHVISMTNSMSDSVMKIIKKESIVIGNFIDEEPLEKYRKKNKTNGALRFVYIGSLTKNKQPLLVIEAMVKLLKLGIKAELSIIGKGPLLDSLKLKVTNQSISGLVHFHGYLEKPYKEISNSDVLVMPSLTEGVSRAVLEALYLGVPCVVRDIEGSSEIITPGVNGEIFRNDFELAEIMLKAANLSRTKLNNRKIITPTEFRQEIAIKKYTNLFGLKLK